MWRLLLVLCVLDSLATVGWLRSAPCVVAERPTLTNSNGSLSDVFQSHIEACPAGWWIEPNSGRTEYECLWKVDAFPVALSATEVPTPDPTTPATIPSVLESPTTILAGPSESPATPTIPVTDTPVATRPSRGLSRAAVSSTNSNYGQSSISLLAAHAQAQAQADSATSTPAPVREGTKKALAIGFNYECDKVHSTLRYATRDAYRFAKSLTKFGYTSENVKVITDKENQPLPSCEYILLVSSNVSTGWSKICYQAIAGCSCFSGHCASPMGQEPYLVMSDSTSIARSTFQDRLISRVPAGAELIVVLDCCHAAAMARTRYCVDRMGYSYKPDETVRSEALPRVERPAAPVALLLSQLISLRGLLSVNQVIAPLGLQKIPAMAQQFSFGTPAHVPARPNRGGLAAAALISPVIGTMPQPTVSGRMINPAQARRMVVAGAPILGQFQERKSGYVAPAGKVIVWAATGERQKAFEASSGLENGIFTNALCKVLGMPLGLLLLSALTYQDSMTDTCANSMVTHRDLWKSVVDAVDQENSWRNQRDSKKPKRPPVNTRIQCAELLVAQASPLCSPSPILNRCVF
ncbi:unnamed protein product [Rhizoctonia solani]|uniref:Peptidase C14 caspase domain-containing protein n=1 Tax=Rhizoctonia solani TaxID=456999 RepID=A0A8H3D2X9_9AGAM|nr:unnamed protein product [Rhizoctonia solani]